jgi:AcrR family transcriptional regulator
VGIFDVRTAIPDRSCEITSSAMGQPTAVTGSATRPRRVGPDRERALLEAASAELAAAGYASFTMDGVAARAHCSKATLYRRWTSKHHLVQAVLRRTAPPLPQVRAESSARANLLMLFRSHCDVLAGNTAFPSVDIIDQILPQPDLRAIFAQAVLIPRLTMTESILQAAIDDGEIDAAVVTPLTAHIGYALINQHFLLTGTPPSQKELACIVDTVLPAGRAGRRTSSHRRRPR